MRMTFLKRYVSFPLLVTLVGCGSNLAPVSELKWQPYSHNQKTHTVQRGETLYAIAFHYDTDFRTLARLNYVRPPYSLRVGQVLSLQGIVREAATPRQTNQIKAPPIASPAIYSPVQRYSRSSSGWLWPVSGRVVTSFIPEQGKKA